MALEPTVVVVPYPGAPAPPPKPQDSDCEIVDDDPAVVAYKPKKDWAKKRMLQTKKTLVLHLPRCDAQNPRREAAAAQEEAPPSPQNGADPGAEKQENRDSGSESMDKLD